MLIAVAGFACNEKSSDADEKDKPVEGAAHSDSNVVHTGDVKIAFVVADSISLRYKRIIDAQKEGEELLKKMQGELKAEENRIRAAYKKFQEDYDIMPSRQQAAEQQRIQQMEQNYQQKQLQAEQTIQDFQTRMTLGNYKKMDEFLAEYAEANGYDFIFSKSLGNAFLYGRNAFDVTEEVIEGLNKAYDESFEEEEGLDLED